MGSQTLGDGVSVLLVEDEVAQRRLIAEILGREGHEIREAGTVDEALQAVAEMVPDLILCDWRMPGRDGGELLDEVRQRALGCAFIVMTAYGSIAHAVDAIRRGADDYLGKPFEREALLLAVQRVLRTRRLERENRELREAVREGDSFGELIGRSQAMRALYRTIEKVGATDATVLVVGESGTGKELVARSLHRASRRVERPFVAVNCAAIPDTLIESELFGHEKGSFTGAHRRREGRFEEADAGHFFLDEIASMPVPLQATLLRVLQERRFTRVGGSGEIESDVRVIAASNRDLPALVSEGAFREDLFYRLNVISIELPPPAGPHGGCAAARCRLSRTGVGPPRHRDSTAVARRAEDPDGARLAGQRTRARQRRRAPGLLAEDGRPSIEDLPAEMRRSTVGEEGCPFSLPVDGLVWEQVERGMMRQALERSQGNRAAAARLMGLTYKAFLYRLEKFGMAGENENGVTESPEMGS